MRHELQGPILRRELQGGQEVGEVLLRMGEVHLVQQHDLDGVPMPWSTCPVQRLKELLLVEPLLEGVVVANEILGIAPAGLHFDHRGRRADCAGERPGEAGLAGPS